MLTLSKAARQAGQTAQADEVAKPKYCVIMCKKASMQRPPYADIQAKHELNIGATRTQPPRSNSYSTCEMSSSSNARTLGVANESVLADGVTARVWHQDISMHGRAEEHQVANAAGGAQIA